MNQLKRYEDLPFQKKLFFVFGFSLVFCIVVAVFVLTDYCTRILVRNNIDNLTVISQQAGIDFNRRVSIQKNSCLIILPCFRSRTV